MARLVIDDYTLKSWVNLCNFSIKHGNLVSSCCKFYNSYRYKQMDFIDFLRYLWYNGRIGVLLALVPWEFVF